MMTRTLGHVSAGAGAAFTVCLSAWLLAAPPAGALVDTAHVVSGGSTLGRGLTRFTAPGLATIYQADFLGAGLGESAAQILMPAGTLSKLRVKILTEAAPSSGSFTAMVRVNGADTVLTCQLSATGQCSSGNKSKALSNNALVAVRVSNNFPDSGAVAFSYTLQFD